MTREDIQHLSQVTHSLRSKIDEQEFDQLIDRMLWAIHSSHDNPHFDDNRFAAACRGDGFEIFGAEHGDRA
jgi:hypothetical protein